jgi:hypothetical protein
MALHLVQVIVNDRLPVPELSETSSQPVALATPVSPVQATARYWSLVRKPAEQTFPVVSLVNEPS